MNWDSVISTINATFTGVTNFINRLKPLYDEGKLVFEEVKQIAQWVSDNKDSFEVVDFNNLITQLLENGSENTYKAIVQTMTFAELLEFQRLSLEQLKEQNNKKYQQLYAIRTLASIPERLWPLIQTIF